MIRDSAHASALNQRKAGLASYRARLKRDGPEYFVALGKKMHAASPSGKKALNRSKQAVLSSADSKPSNVSNVGPYMDNRHDRPGNRPQDGGPGAPMNICEVYQQTGRLEDLTLLAQATDEDLLQFKMLVDEDVALIAAQLLKARQTVVTSGQYSDPNWYRNAELAKKFKGQLSQRVQGELSQRRARRRQAATENETQRRLDALLLAVNALPAEYRTRVHDKYHQILDTETK